MGGGRLKGLAGSRVSSLSLLLVSVLQSGEASLFEVNIRYIGGLLSAYYLTGEEVSGLGRPGTVWLERDLENIQSCPSCHQWGNKALRWQGLPGGEGPGFQVPPEDSSSLLLSVSQFCHLGESDWLLMLSKTTVSTLSPLHI